MLFVMKAELQAQQKRTNRHVPTCSEINAVAGNLGHAGTAPPIALSTLALSHLSGLFHHLPPK